MDFSLSGEQTAFVDEVAAFCRKHCADVDINELERTGSDPEDIEAKLVESGYYGLPFPEAYGGKGKDFFYFGLLLEGLLRGGYPYPGRFQATMLNALNVFESGSESQKKEILPKVISGEATLSISLTEPNSGTDVASLKTKAVEMDGGFAITGQKVYSSGAAGEKNIIVAGVRTDPAAPRHKG
ncbi:MAG: acyl-CoA/acyl-ACP dehydrogenase, partial [Desulfatitalea sp.]|nr:acyl-CoA/acyl-ACP dehydrogenase [Desulfatitalea sp.]NNJ99668.1 acyl-CoA/acyl-ACP dehydrogenase [Desulfatitalea sp.]